MAAKTKTPQPSLTHQYKATVQFEAEAASLNLVAALAGVVVVLIGGVANRLIMGDWSEINSYIAVPAVLTAAICFFGIKIANQWERAVVLRLERFLCLKGPGPFFVIPIIDTVAHSVDMRIHATDFSSESTLTKDLEDAMSKETQAERERHARIILGTAETEIAEKFAQAAKQYESNPGAMHLRGMNMLFEGLKAKGSMVIVPSSALDTMNLGAIGGLTALRTCK